MKGKRKKAHLLGLGLDNKDGHVRITQGEDFTVLSGSEATHEHMQETCIKVGEKLKRRGKRLDDVSTDELRDLIQGSG